MAVTIHYSTIMQVQHTTSMKIILWLFGNNAQLVQFNKINQLYTASEIKRKTVGKVLEVMVILLNRRSVVNNSGTGQNKSLKLC